MAFGSNNTVRPSGPSVQSSSPTTRSPTGSGSSGMSGSTPDTSPNTGAPGGLSKPSSSGTTSSGVTSTARPTARPTSVESSPEKSPVKAVESADQSTPAKSTASAPDKAPASSPASSSSGSDRESLRDERSDDRSGSSQSNTQPSSGTDSSTGGSGTTKAPAFTAGMKDFLADVTQSVGNANAMIAQAQAKKDAEAAAATKQAAADKAEAQKTADKKAAEAEKSPVRTAEQQQERQDNYEEHLEREKAARDAAAEEQAAKTAAAEKAAADKAAAADAAEAVKVPVTVVVVEKAKDGDKVVTVSADETADEFVFVSTEESDEAATPVSSKNLNDGLELDLLINTAEVLAQREILLADVAYAEGRGFIGRLLWGNDAPVDPRLADMSPQERTDLAFNERVYAALVSTIAGMSASEWVKPFVAAGISNPIAQFIVRGVFGATVSRATMPPALEVADMINGGLLDKPLVDPNPGLLSEGNAWDFIPGFISTIAAMGAGQMVRMAGPALLGTTMLAPYATAAAALAAGVYASGKAYTHFDQGWQNFTFDPTNPDDVSRYLGNLTPEQMQDYIDNQEMLDIMEAYLAREGVLPDDSADAPEQTDTGIPTVTLTPEMLEELEQYLNPKPAEEPALVAGNDVAEEDAVDQPGVTTVATDGPAADLDAQILSAEEALADLRAQQAEEALAEGKNPAEPTTEGAQSESPTVVTAENQSESETPTKTDASTPTLVGESGVVSEAPAATPTVVAGESETPVTTVVAEAPQQPGIDHSGHDHSDTESSDSTSEDGVYDEGLLQFMTDAGCDVFQFSDAQTPAQYEEPIAEIGTLEKFGVIEVCDDDGTFNELALAAVITDLSDGQLDHSHLSPTEDILAVA